MWRFLRPQIIFIFIVACVGRILFAGVKEAGATGVNEAGATGVKEAGATDSFADQLMRSLSLVKTSEEQRKKLSTLTGIVDNCKKNKEFDAEFKLLVVSESGKNLINFADVLVFVNQYEEQAKHCLMMFNKFPLVLLPENLDRITTINHLKRKALEKRYPINLGEPTGNDNTESEKILQEHSWWRYHLLERFSDILFWHTKSIEGLSTLFNEIIGAMEAGAKSFSDILYWHTKSSESLSTLFNEIIGVNEAGATEEIGTQSEVEPCAEEIGTQSEVEPCADSFAGQAMCLLNLVQLSEEDRRTLSALSDSFDECRNNSDFLEAFQSIAWLSFSVHTEGIAERVFTMINKFPLVLLPENLDANHVLNCLKDSALKNKYPRNLGEPTGEIDTETMKFLSSERCPTLLKTFFDDVTTSSSYNNNIEKSISQIIEHANKSKKHRVNQNVSPSVLVT